MYHRIVDSVENDVYNMCVSAANFREHMSVLARSGCCVPTGPFRYAHLPDTHGLGRIEITFDDGYEDNYEYALPVLDAYGLSATFFLCAQNILTGEPLWYERVRECNTAGLLWMRENMRGLCAVDSIAESACGVPKHTPVSVSWDALLHDVVATAKLVDPDERDRLINTAVNMTNYVRDSAKDTLPRMMTAAQVRNMSRNPAITIGSHGLTHTRFAILDEQKQYGEMLQSRIMLQRMTGHVVDQFAFPFGRPVKDYTANSLKQARLAGYRSCYSTVPSRRYILRPREASPRFEVKNWSRDEFIGRLDDWLTLS